MESIAGKQFYDDVLSVYRLGEIDKPITQICIASLGRVAGTLKDEGKSGTANKISHSITSLENIALHGSLKNNFEMIYGQCIVLMVSYFSSALENLFVEYTSTGHLKKTLKEIPLKVSVNDLIELKDDFNRSLGYLILEKADINMQDMQSILKTYKEYFEIDVSVNNYITNIIAAQAVRHCLVHKAGKIDERCIRQTKDRFPRDVFVDLEIGRGVKVSMVEVEQVGNSMIWLMNQLEKAL